MDKEQFLRDEYARIIISGEFVASEWRDSVERFIADLWDMTTFNKAGRYLAPKDKTLGYSRDNVEFHFDKAKRAVTSNKPKKANVGTLPSGKTKAAKLTSPDLRAEQTAARLERRQKLIDKALAWELRARSG